MSLFELLVLLGVDPKIARWKAIIWFSSVMIVGFLVMIGGFLAYAYSLLGELWILIMIPYFVGAYLSGHIFGIFDTSKDRSIMRDLGHIITEILLFRVNREQPLERLVIWRAAGFVVAIIFSVFLTHIWLAGGSPYWNLIAIPIVIAFYLIGRRFGHFR